MLWRKDEMTPSLRRHYPDQVFGYDLRLSNETDEASFAAQGQTPREH